jgi:hypothetical protein
MEAILIAVVFVAIVAVSAFFRNRNNSIKGKKVDQNSTYNPNAGGSKPEKSLNDNI